MKKLFGGRGRKQGYRMIRGTAYQTFSDMVAGQSPKNRRILRSARRRHPDWAGFQGFPKKI